MTNLILLLDSRMERPRGYGLFHLLFVALIVIATVLLCHYFKNCSDKTYRKILLITWIALVILELYKEFNLCVGIDGSRISANYQWYIFPFQFCSTLLYILPLIIFMKECSIRRACIAFLSIFVLIAGISVMVYPELVFCDIIGVNIQTMIHHGSQVVIGVFSLVKYRDKFKMITYIPAFAVFFAFVAIAIVLNELMFPLIPEEQTFNMFLISRHYTSSMPILCDIQNKIPYILFLAVYVFGFGAAALAFYAGELGILALSKRKGNRKAKTD